LLPFALTDCAIIVLLHCLHFTFIHLFGCLYSVLKKLIVIGCFVAGSILGIPAGR